MKWMAWLMVLFYIIGLALCAPYFDQLLKKEVPAKLSNLNTTGKAKSTASKKNLLCIEDEKSKAEEEFERKLEKYLEEEKKRFYHFQNELLLYIVLSMVVFLIVLGACAFGVIALYIKCFVKNSDRSQRTQSEIERI